MSGVSMADIKALRDRLGAGMMDSKKALVEAGGNLDKAVEILRLKGLKGVARREGRTTSEGLVTARQIPGRAFMLELACETDFVAKNEKFIALSERIMEVFSASEAKNLQEVLALSLEGKSVETVISEEAAILGEKLELRRVRFLSGDRFSIYLHRTNPDLPPQVGVVLAYAGEDADTARSIAQHIAFADPQYLSSRDVPEAVVTKEREIITEISRKEGKPAAATPKIIEGRLRAFYKQIALLDQDYARDNKFIVAEVLERAGVRIEDFARFRVGAKV